jgi:DNA-3-methyladenine glycosylase II
MSRTITKIIRTNADIAAGVHHLRRVCPVMRTIHDRTGDPPLRRYEAGFEGLARIVTGQQLSIASAAAIWSRVHASLQPFTPEALLAASDARLEGCGLSRAKIRTLRTLSGAIASGDLELDGLARAEDATVRAALTAVSGIGPWTADIYVLFCLGRADAWAAGDLALQVGAARATGEGERLNAVELETLAERWRPWRGVAARLIWADYAYLRRLPGAGEVAGRPPPRLSRISRKP